MSISMIQQQVSTPQGFAKIVSAKRGVFIGGITLLLVGLGCVAMNLFQMGTASDWDWRFITQYFFDANAIEFTGRRSGRAEVWHFIYVYLPLIAIPAGIILLVVHFVTRKNSAAGLFNEFSSRGWIGRQRAVGLQVKNGNANANVTFISHPSVSDEVFDSAIQHYSAFVAGLDKKGLRDVATAATKAGVLTGADAATLMPGAPTGLIAAVVRGKGEFVAVIPPAQGEKGKFRILPVKTEALTASYTSPNIG